jgi:hypothetical protein
MWNYLSLHVTVIWEDVHWRIVAVQEDENGDQGAPYIVGGVIPRRHAPSQRQEIAETLLAIGLQCAPDPVGKRA